MSISRRITATILWVYLHYALSHPVLFENKDLSLPLSRTPLRDKMINVTLPNPGSLAIPIPRSFVIVAQNIQANRYSREACFLSTINVLKEVAPGNFHGEMPRSIFKTQKFPNLVISLDSAFLSLIERRYVIWGLFLAIRYMIDFDAFQPILFSLRWENEEVGSIEYGPPSVMSQQLEHDFNQTKALGPGAASLSAPTDTTTSVMVQPVSNRHLSIHFTYFGNPPPNIGKSNVFMTIISALVQAAIPDADFTVLYTFIVRLDGGNCALMVSSEAPSRTTPPFLRYGDLIHALADAANFYLGNRLYTQLHMQLTIDGVLLASAVFLYTPNTKTPL
ncbi:MAG: hypothetical protein Q9209_004320 [Squamulea sp. 1 TL-2023]